MVVRAALRFGFGTASLLAGGWVLRALHGAPAALGATPAEIAGRRQRSPNYQDGVFVNLDPASGISLDREEQRKLVCDLIGLRDAARPARTDPAGDIRPSRCRRARLAVSWYGHSTAMIEIDGYRVLADPVWSRRCSPSHTVGPQRMHEVPVPLEALPAVDAVMISHDHYDHLDIDTIIGLGPHPARAVRRAARRRRAPAQLGHPRGPHRRTRLEREPPNRRTDAGVHPRPALLRAAVRPATPRCGRRG